MTAFYNEIDPYAAAWLRNLIAAGHIAPGVVDERSIVDLDPDELAGYKQCHFFAGIGVWSHALRLAGWPDDRPVWTGSCPCQPFSAAGKGKGHEDERHLWPAWFRLIEKRRPAVVFGEQVASADGLAWLDPLCADMEGAGYAIAAANLPAAGVGAPHIRARLFFVADSDGAERRPQSHRGGDDLEAFALGTQGAGFGRERRAAGFLADSDGGIASEGSDGRLAGIQRSGEYGLLAPGGRPGLMGDADPAGRRRCAERNKRPATGEQAPRRADAERSGVQPAGGVLGNTERNGLRISGRPAADLAHESSNGALRGALGNTDSEREAPQRGLPRGPDAERIGSFWSAADWIACRDGKSRPVEPVPLEVVDGIAESLGRLRASDVAEVEREMNAWSIRHQADAREALRDVWRALSAPALRQRSIGRPGGVSQPAVLLSFLRQLEIEGWPVAQGVSRAGSEAPSAGVRMLRLDGAPAGASLRRGLDEQPTEQPADPLHVLPSLLARHAQAAWGEAFDAHAAATFPLAHGAPARVGRLRAYGNAIVPQAAAAVIGAYMEAA